MANKIKVNTKKLKTDVTSIESDLNAILKKLDKMNADVKSLNKMWSGDANTAFNTVFTEDIASLQNVCNSVAGIINYESNACTQYNKCENSVSDLVSSISV